MPKIAYINKRFNRSSVEIIDTANNILEEYSDQGFVFTLRQLYYQFVARDLIANTQQSYDRLGSILNDARLAGLVDWDHLQDRTRKMEKNGHWSSPTSILRAVTSQYAIDKWQNQDFRPEVWIEKDALVGVIEGICSELDVPYFSCRGYTSQSEMWGAGQRMERHIAKGQTPVVFHFGDHDPSGIDMTRDIQERLSLFTDSDIPVKRMALNDFQIKKYKCPPNPVKFTDSRAKDYIKEYGRSSWELDALEPSVIIDLVKTVIVKLRDEKQWKEMLKQENLEKDILASAERFVESQTGDDDE